MESEFRQDIVSGDWILIAPRRARRGHSFIQRIKRVREPKKTCVFEDPEKYGNKVIGTYLDHGHDWRIKIIRNKFPAVAHSHRNKKLFKETKKSIYSVFAGIGHHEIVITRDHDAGYENLDIEDASQVLQAFRDRYLEFIRDRNLSYVSIFHNSGLSAGASVYHPHYQIVAIPIIPPDVRHSLHGSHRYYEEHKRCVHCDMISLEQREKKRIIFENKSAVVFAPYVSRTPFEMRIFPKEHSPFFEETNPETMTDIAECLQVSINRMKKALACDYNFFVHTSPIANKSHYHHYHWHIELLPKLTHLAGFELNTGITVNTVDPDHAAKLLRKA